MADKHPDELYVGTYAHYYLEAWLCGERVETLSPIKEAQDKGLIQKWDDKPFYRISIEPAE